MINFFKPRQVKGGAKPEKDAYNKYGKVKQNPFAVKIFG